MRYFKLFCNNNRIGILFLLIISLNITGCARHDSATYNHLHDQTQISTANATSKSEPKKVSFHVEHGIIQAAGFADDKEELNKIANKLESYHDKFRIINNVKVLSTKDNPLDERALNDAIINELTFHHYPIQDVAVHVRNGHVILSGFINRHVDLKDLTFVVETVPGVNKVDNYILYRQFA